MKDKKTSRFRIFANNFYALKSIWQISRSRVIHSALSSIVGYVEWIFMSIFFLRYVIGAIENEAPVESILFFIGMCFVVFLLLAVYNSYLNAVIYPYTDNKIYRVLYRKLYAKARNVELSRLLKSTVNEDEHTIYLRKGLSEESSEAELLKLYVKMKVKRAEVTVFKEELCDYLQIVMKR